MTFLKHKSNDSTLLFRTSNGSPLPSRGRPIQHPSHDIGGPLLSCPPDFPSFISHQTLNSAHWPYQVPKYARFSCISGPFCIEFYSLQIPLISSCATIFAWLPLSILKFIQMQFFWEHLRGALAQAHSSPWGFYSSLCFL